MSPTLKVSIIIPVLNEEKHIEKCIADLQVSCAGGHEIIFVDGGSVDKTLALISRHSHCTVMSSVRGRAKQMNAGAMKASGDVLLFLHVDTKLPVGTISLLEENLVSDKKWGRFDVRLSGTKVIFRVIETMMNWRSRLTSVSTGDQVIFISRELFKQVGEYPDLPLMEDIAISKNLRQLSKPVCIDEKVITSSRRWEENGIMKTVFLMWQLRFLYFIGVPAEKLIRRYN